MNIVSLASVVVVSIALAACSHTASTTLLAATPSERVLSERQSRVPGEYVVTLGAGENSGVISERYGHLGIKSISPLGGVMFLLNLTNDPGPQEMQALISADSRIKAVQPNYIYRADRSGKYAD
jgi:hypothetical protein